MITTLKSRILTYAPEAISLLLLIAAILTEHVKPAYALFFSLASLLPVLQVCIRPTYEQWRDGKFFNEFTLMALASVGAFIIGEYPEGAAILLFFSIGEKMENSASDIAKSRISSLLEIIPDSVTILTPEDETVTKKPEDVTPNEIMIVMPGQRVALDSILLSDDNISIDCSAITGESIPVTARPDMIIPAGTIVLDRQVQLKVLRPYAESTLARIMSMIDDATVGKSRPESMLRKVTRYYTPIVIIASLLLFTVPCAIRLINGMEAEWAVWFKRSLILLVCSCPCALVISIPLSYFSAIGTASRLGILFKSSGYLDAMRQCDTLLMDKTGTITNGHFSVINVLPSNNHNNEEVLGLAGIVEAHSNHPIAKAIQSLAPQRIQDITPINNLTVFNGVICTTNHGTILVGSRKLLEEHGIDLSDLPPVEYTELCVGMNGEYIGAILLSDVMKPCIAETIVDLRMQGITSIGMLSGDHEKSVARVARMSGVDFHKSGMMPGDKYKYLKSLLATGRKAIFVGDGINDAPSLAAATVGIAIGTGGTQIAMESSDAVIVGNSLYHLATAMRISRRLRTVVVTNVSLAIIVKLAVIILGALGIASLWAAVFADTGIMIVTIVWSLIAISPRMFRSSNNK